VALCSSCRLPPFIIPANHPTRPPSILAAGTCRNLCSLPIGLLLLFSLSSTLRRYSHFHLTLLLLLQLSGPDDVGSSPSHASAECSSGGRSFGLRGQARLLRLCPGYLQGRLEQGECRASSFTVKKKRKRKRKNWLF
jgi:hypothetical protein